MSKSFDQMFAEMFPDAAQASCAPKMRAFFAIGFRTGIVFAGDRMVFVDGPRADAELRVALKQAEEALNEFIEFAKQDETKGCNEPKK